MSARNAFGGTKCDYVSIPCNSCGDAVTAHLDYLTPVTLCGACTPEHWDGASLPIHAGAVDWAAILDHPCMPTRDHASYDALTGHLPALELDRREADRLRALTRKDAA